MKRKYGATYQGSKSKIAEAIIDILPSKKYLVDAFAGGGALSDCALQSNKFEEIIVNDIQTKDILESHFFWTPEQTEEFQKKWITPEEFRETDNLHIKNTWSFSNNKKTYLYSKKCYEYKRLLHNAICFDEYKEFEEYSGLDISSISIHKNLNKRRVAARTAVLEGLRAFVFKNDKGNDHIPECIYNDILDGKKDWRERAIKELDSSKNISKLFRAQNLENARNVLNFNTNNLIITTNSYEKIKLPSPEETVIICDPPYRNTQGYQIEFDNDKFEHWCIDKAKEGYKIFVCEYNIENPAFEEVWSKDVRNQGGGNKNHKWVTERLYKVKQ